jgi:hypothetical protein
VNLVFAILKKNSAKEKSKEPNSSALHRDRNEIELLKYIEKIKKRIKDRDNKSYDIETLEKNQITEITYSKEIALLLGIPFLEI